MAVYKKDEGKNKNIGIIYKYVYNGVVVYVGQTKRSLERRIEEHAKETRFQGLTNVWYYEVPFEGKELLAIENFWIHHYSALMNFSKGVFGRRADVDINSVKWRPYTKRIKCDKPFIVEHKEWIAKRARTEKERMQAQIRFEKLCKEISKK